MKYNSEIIYQVYPLTFNDSNGDGIGDILGIVEKLDYIKSLGASYIWLSPIMKSPMKDNGYDVSDYMKVDPIFGTNDDYINLIKEAGKKNMKIMMDLVMNHTSDQHEWFIKSIKKIKPFDDYYVWRKEPVPGFNSQFENTSWTYVPDRGEYYLHQFSKHQPDLNWENPEILKEFRKIISYWVKQGVSGFRFDVVDMIGKQIDKGIKIDVDRSFKLLEKLGENIFTKNKLLTVGECWSTGRTQSAKYTTGNNAILSMVFNARYMFMHEDGSRWKRKPFSREQLVKYKTWIYEQNNILSKSLIPNFVENHDFGRVISRLFSDDSNMFEKAKLLMTVHFLKRGVTFIFQGQELGLPNPKYKSINEINDVETKKVINVEPEKNVYFGTRDNSRKPLPWNSKVINKIIPFYVYENKYFVESEINNVDSPLNFWKHLINIKNQYSDLIINGNYELILKNDSNTFSYKISYEQQELIVITTWFDDLIVDVEEYAEIFSQNFLGKKLLCFGIFIGYKNTKSKPGKINSTHKTTHNILVSSLIL